MFELRKGQYPSGYVKRLIMLSGLNNVTRLLLLFWIDNPIEVGESIEAYSIRIGLSYRTVYRAKHELIAAGFIVESEFL